MHSIEMTKTENSKKYFSIILQMCDSLEIKVRAGVANSKSTFFQLMKKKKLFADWQTLFLQGFFA